jgi:hypothetical protein
MTLQSPFIRANPANFWHGWLEDSSTANYRLSKKTPFLTDASTSVLSYGLILQVNYSASQWYMLSAVANDSIVIDEPKDWGFYFPWLQEAIELEKAGRSDKALRIVFKHLNTQLLRCEYSECDRLLDIARVDEISPKILLAILTVTLQFHNKLRNRAKFFMRVKERFHYLQLRDRSLLAGLG